MKKITKLLVAFVMLFGLGLLFINNLPKAKAAGNPLTTLSVGGYVFSNVDSDLHSSYYDSTDVSWQYLSASKKLVLYDYHGPQITMFMESGDFCPAIDVFGECVINVEGDINPGILFEGSALVQPLVTFNGENASLTINGGNCGIKSITDGEKKIYFEAAEQSKLNIYSNGIGVDAGVFFLTYKVDAYINSKGYGIFAPYSGAYTISGVSNSSCSLTIISKERTALPVDSLYADKQIHLSNNFDEAKEYVSSDNKVYHVASEEKYMEGFLQFTDLSGKLRAINSKYININVGDTETLGFNNIQLPTSMEGYRIERTIEYTKNGASDPTYTVTNDLTTNLSYDVTPSNIDLYILKYTLKLKNGTNTISTISELNRIYPIDSHTISTNINGLKIVPISHPTCEVKTGDFFQFKVQMEDYYLNSGITLYYADGEELGYIHSSLYTIDNVRKDIVIYSNEALSYKTIFKVYSNDEVIDSGERSKGLSYTLPTLNQGQIPSGMTFDYWKVGDRTTHYPYGSQIEFTEAERGEIRIEAHFADRYNLTIEDGNFYKNSDCTIKIGYAASGDTVYFKFDSVIGVIEDGKMLSGYDLNGASGFIVHDMGTYYEFDMPSSDVYVSPVYKYVIDEMTVLNVKHPMGNTELIENQECAPEDADYVVEPNSQWFKIDGSNRTLVNTFGYGDSYVFENNSTYEVEIKFRYNDGFIFNPNGYSRNDDYQFHINGLDDLEYEVISCIFTNASKSLYKVILRFNSINKYEVSVTDGSSYIGTDVVEYAAYGETILLSANVAPTGKAFDKWIITGVTVDEEALNGSKLSITMPDNDVTAIATYKDVEYFEVTFNNNGGTGIIDDDISYGEYILPACTFEAPEHKHFKCWSVNGTEYNELVEITVYSNIEVKAIWELDTFAISFDNNGGTGTMDSETKDYGTEFTLPECTFTAPSHKHFVGWSLEEEGAIITTTSITIEENITLYAIYAIDTFNVSFDNNGGTGSMTSETKNYGTEFTLPECTFIAPEHKHFAGWSLESDGAIITTTSITIESNVTLYAIYAIDTFTVSFNANGGTGTMNPETKDYGTEYTLPTCSFTTPDKKRFKGWSLETDGTIISTTTIEITDNVTLYAIYEDMPEDVTLSKIEISGTYKTTYKVGDTFSTDGIIITATYSDNTTQNIALSLVTVSGYNMNNAGTQTVTITYEGKTATFTITVEKKVEPTPVDPVNPDPVEPDDPTPTPEKKKNNAGLIVGITLGSVALCAAIAVGAVLIIKKKH